MKDRPRTDYALLGLLAAHPMSGAELRDTIQNSIRHFWSESFGQVYPALKRMAGEGLVEALPPEATGKRPRIRYAITDAGRAALSGWFGEAIAPQPPRQEMLLKLFFAPHAPPGVLRAQVEEYRTRNAVHLAHLEAAVAGIEDRLHPDAPYWKMTARQGILVLRATVAWADETLTELDRLSA